MIEIKFRGRGGQGAVVASEILARSFFLEGKYPQCFSLFGGERRGAPVVGFLRVDEEPILLKCQIYRPDHMIIFDFSLIDEKEILQELKPKGTLLINTHQAIDFFPEIAKIQDRPGGCGSDCEKSWSGGHIQYGHAGGLCAFDRVDPAQHISGNGEGHGPGEKRRKCQSCERGL